MRVAGRFPGSTMGLRKSHCHSQRRSGSPCHTGCRVCMQLSALRLYRCQCCGLVVLICSRCDRGQRYCATGCARIARRHCVRRAGQRYQQSRAGRRHHAERQQRHRCRQKQKVTHQGPPQQTAPVVLGASGATTLPVLEESDVPNPVALTIPAPEVQERPLAALPPRADPQSNKPPPGNQSLDSEHLCHFCQCTGSRYLRRDSVCHLRRRLATAARQRPAQPPPRSPP